MAEKLFHVTLALGVPASGEVVQAFANLPSVSQVTATDHTLQFIVQGSVDPVVKKASDYPILSLTSHEPTLEEAFLEYYK